MFPKSGETVPEVRFPGFTDAWEQRKFEDIAKRRSDSTISSNSLPCVEYEDVISEQGTLNKDISQKELAKTGIEFESGDVLFGKLRPYLKNWLLPDFNGVAVGDWWVLKPVSTDGNFLYRLIQTSEFMSVANVSSGSKMPRSDWALVSKTYFSIPPDIAEQQKIGAFFRDIDNTITLHQRKLESMKLLKKSLLQKMFPKSGETVPEVRFPGFTDAWEQRKLGELGTTYTGISGKTSSDFGHGDARFITYMNVYSNAIANPLMVEPIEIDQKQNEVKVGDVFFTTSSETPDEVGMSSVLLEKQGTVYLNSFCFGYRPKEKIDLHYLAFMLRSEVVRKKIIFLAQGISRYNISKNKMMEISVPLPTIEEQSKIGGFLNNLDNLITLHQRKVEALQKLKKSLLQQMFV